jgi:DNA-binding NtrC family response regulator
MARRLIFFGDVSGAAQPYLSDCFAASDLTHEYVAWDTSALLCSRRVDIVVLWAAAAPHEVITAFELMKNRPLDAPILAVLPEDADSSLVMRASESADDFMFLPVRKAEFQQRVQRMLGPDANSVDGIARRLGQEFEAVGLVGRDPAFLQTLTRIPLAARNNSPVLIVGETGTGKELVARAIGALSVRRDFAFIPVDCASIPDHLFENEMFGHTRGAFTDARADQKGLIAMANGGTLFLDEIDSLSPGAQSKLLRFLQERSYRPLGSDRFLRADVKLLAATNKDLNRLVEAKQFRSDLLFRLNVLRLELVPLRERATDIALLARHFVKMICVEYGIARKTLTPGAQRKLQEYSWPGNIRELYNMMQRAVTFSEAPQISPCDLDQGWAEPVASPARVSFREARAKAIESFERRYVADLLRECGGNVTRSARMAQKERRAFGRLVKRYGAKENVDTFPLPVGAGAD